jgi:hypothetical protein
MINALLEKEIFRANARAAASDACRAIMKRALETETELLGKKRKNRRTVKHVKGSARYVVHETMKELHASRIREKATGAREAAEKEAQETLEEPEAARMSRIEEETKRRIFTGA